MALHKAKYRLTRGTHNFPNPDFNPEKNDGSIPSHFTAEVGDVIELTDDQFKAFKDKFQPIGTDATDVRDHEAEKLADAKAAAVLTGDTVDPNKPLDPKVQAAVNALKPK